MQKVSDHCYAALNEANRVCDANSGLINLGGGVVIDTQSDLPHAQQMIDLFSQVWTAMPTYVVLSHEDIDHVAGNQLFPGAEIIAHRWMPERTKIAADPAESQHILQAVADPHTRDVLTVAHPGLLAAGDQLAEGYNFDGIELVLPTTLFDHRHVLDLDGTEAHLIYVGPAHQVGDVIVHLPSEGVLFAGDVLFDECTPMGWVGSYEQFFSAIDTMIDLDPPVVVPGHGPVCGIEALRAEREYFQHVYDHVAGILRRGAHRARRPPRRCSSAGSVTGRHRPGWHSTSKRLPRVPRRGPRCPLGQAGHLRLHLQPATTRGMPVEY